MFQIDLKNRKPIYEQLVEKFKELIINDVLKADEKIPSVRDLAKQLTINPNTIQKAYRELERQGYIYSVRGRGSFVSKKIEKVDKEKVEKLKNEIIKNLSELIYLGFEKKELIKLLEETYDRVKGGENK
ncbi:GntR family transcriptional regulator [Caloranaerobacter azorensis H53214]|uniref:GntR family transcriptional regulator n=2 Tax=Caloranaerobacter azorensis TaxID=116090 RepID=A0A1M5U542_9FIRM|nr:GntR family transcriptional regulator [Caloranaerobacter azorensis]KGG79910.1 GntR family transcriptional regulator [Caloranaerobacter azorensis H53214]SHH58058.1 GntR family transcriptional regulator [Caloranaerobacter azorensis DSM 13643]